MSAHALPIWPLQPPPRLTAGRDRWDGYTGGKKVASCSKCTPNTRRMYQCTTCVWAYCPAALISSSTHVVHVRHPIRTSWKKHLCRERRRRRRREMLLAERLSSLQANTEKAPDQTSQLPRQVYRNKFATSSVTRPCAYEQIDPHFWHFDKNLCVCLVTKGNDKQKKSQYWS